MSFILFAAILALNLINHSPILVRMGRKGYLIPPVDSVHELCDQLESIYGVRVNLKRSKLTLQGKTIGATETLASRGDSLEVEISDTSVYNLEHKRRQKDVKNGVNEDVPIVDEGDIKAAMEKMKTSNPMDILNSFVDNDDVYKIFEDKEQMEMARRILLRNIDKYDAAMPGFKQQALAVASSPRMWRAAMHQVRAQVEALRSRRGPEANLLDVGGDGEANSIDEDVNRGGGGKENSSDESNKGNYGNGKKRSQGNRKPFGLKRR